MTTERIVMSFDFMNNEAMECLRSGYEDGAGWNHDMIVGYLMQYCLNAEHFTESMWVVAQIKYLFSVKRAYDPELELELLEQHLLKEAFLIAEDVYGTFESDEYEQYQENEYDGYDHSEDDYEEFDEYQEYDKNLTDMQIRQLECDREDSDIARRERLDEGQEY